MLSKARATAKMEKGIVNEGALVLEVFCTGYILLFHLVINIKIIFVYRCANVSLRLFNLSAFNKSYFKIKLKFVSNYVFI